jgi:RNA recognition motif-containing protein
LFSKYGRVKATKIVWDKHDRSTGEAIVEYENPRGADDAVKNLNNGISKMFY